MLSIPFLKTVLDWLEVWAILIPLFVLLKKPRQPVYMQPVIYYLFVALFLNIVATLIWKRNSLGLNTVFENNNPFYNLHSIFRLIFFSVFFIRLKQPFLSGVKMIIPFLFIFFVVINFIDIEFFFQKKISSRLHTVESGILLFYCLQYYLFRLKEEQASFTKMPDFWVVTGLSIFVVISFPIYLFYDRMIYLFYGPKLDEFKFLLDIWEVQKIGFLICCILIAKAFNTKE